MNDREPVTSDARGEDARWQQEVITRLAFAALNEQRRSRRWGIFFRVLLFAYLFLLLILLFRPGAGGVPITAGKHTAVVEVDGIIAADSPAGADAVITGLRRAFEQENAAGVIVRINSPGGSPVQAGYINDEIERLRAAYPDKPVYAVVTDICASGGYYVAVAAQEIYADPASVIGSIGVVVNGFGFTEAMRELGIERRLFTAGEHKGMLDPFSPLREKDVAHIKDMLGDIHGQFIEAVKQGRGERLKDDPRLFSGLIWTGEQSLELGLIDGFGSASYVARELIGAERMVDYTPQPNYLEQFADRLGMALANVLYSRAAAPGLY